MSDDLPHLITPLRKALERIERKAAPLLATPSLLETEEGEDRDRKSTRLNSSHVSESRMPSSA